MRGRRLEGDSTAERRAQMGTYVAAGLGFGLVLLAFTGFGYWLDGKAGTLPLFTLLGAALGGVGGFLHLYRSLTGWRDARRPEGRT